MKILLILLTFTFFLPANPAAAQTSFQDLAPQEEFDFGHPGDKYFTHDGISEFWMLYYDYENFENIPIVGDPSMDNSAYVAERGAIVRKPPGDARLRLLSFHLLDKAITEYELPFAEASVVDMQVHVFQDNLGEKVVLVSYLDSFGSGIIWQLIDEEWKEVFNSERDLEAMSFTDFDTYTDRVRNKIRFKLTRRVADGRSRNVVGEFEPEGFQHPLEYQPITIAFDDNSPLSGLPPETSFYSVYQAGDRLRAVVYVDNPLSYYGHFELQDSVWVPILSTQVSRFGPFNGNWPLLDQQFYYSEEGGVFVVSTNHIAQDDSYTFLDVTGDELVPYEGSRLLTDLTNSMTVTDDRIYAVFEGGHSYDDFNLEIVDIANPAESTVISNSGSLPSITSIGSSNVVFYTTLEGDAAFYPNAAFEVDRKRHILTSVYREEGIPTDDELPVESTPESSNEADEPADVGIFQNPVTTIEDPTDASNPFTVIDNPAETTSSAAPTDTNTQGSDESVISEVDQSDREEGSGRPDGNAEEAAEGIENQDSSPDAVEGDELDQVPVNDDLDNEMNQVDDAQTNDRSEPQTASDNDIGAEEGADRTDLVAERELLPTTTVDEVLTFILLGHILLQVQGLGEAWYVNPVDRTRYYLKDGETAFTYLRSFGLGISDSDLEKIPVGFEDRFEDIDSDGDGVQDRMEEGLGTDPFSSDSDGDGFSDRTELENGFNPLGEGRLPIDEQLTERLSGRIVLQVGNRGQAWYINPRDGKRYYMKNGAAAYEIMRFLSLGITNQDLAKIRF
jgi:hypothetical protein